MNIVSLVSTAGGAGRTSLSVHLAQALALSGEHVLLVQLDPLADLCFHLGRADAQAQGWANMAMGQGDLNTLTYAFNDQLNVLEFGQTHAHQPHSAESVYELAPSGVHALGQALRQRSDPWVLLDTPRWPSALTDMAIAMSDKVILIHTPEGRSLTQLRGWTASHKIHLHKVVGVCNRYNPTRILHSDVVDMTRMQWARLMAAHGLAEGRTDLELVHEDAAVAECAATGQTLLDYAPHSQCFEDVQRMANLLQFGDF